MRNRKYETALTNLEKFDEVYDGLMGYFTEINDSVDRLEKFYINNVDDFDKLKQNEIDCKSIEANLMTRQADLRFMKMSYQDYSNLTDSFSRDLQTYCSKLKDKRVKRLSSDTMSDLSYLKSCLEEAENKYQLLVARSSSLRDTISQLCEQNKSLSSYCARFDSWLSETENKISSDLALLESLEKTSGSKPANHVKQLEDMSNKLQSYKTDLQLQRKPIDEIRKSLQSYLNEIKQADSATQEALISNVSSLVSRYESLDKLINEKYASSIDQLTKARNLKQNLDSTNSWLNEIDQVYLNGSHKPSNELNEKLLNTSSDSNDDQLEFYDRLRSELSSRKEALLKNLTGTHDVSSNKMIDQLLDKIGEINHKIDLKSNQSKNLQSLLDEFNANYDSLLKFSKKCANKLESIDMVNGGVLNSKQELETKPTHSQSISNTIQFIQSIQAEIKQNESSILDGVLKPCLAKIESNYVPSLYSKELYQSLELDLNELQLNIDQLLSYTDIKLKELDAMHGCATKYSDSKSSFETWLQTIELKIHSFEPIAIDMEIVENQYEQLQAALSEHEAKSKELDELNRLADQYLTSMTKHQKQDNSFSGRLNITSRRKRRSSNYSADGSMENLSSSFESSIKNNAFTSSSNNVNFGSYEADLEHELRKINELYEWIGERLDERKRDLVNSLELMKSYLQDLNAINTRLGKFESNLAKLFSLSPASLSETDLKLPLQYALISKMNIEFKQMENELNKFNLDIESVKAKGKQFIFDRLTNDTIGIEDVKRQLKDLNDKYSSLNSTYAEFKDKLEQFSANFNSYKQNYDTLTHNLGQKRQMLDIMNMGTTVDLKNPNKLTVNSDLHLIDSQVKQIELLKSDLVKQDSLLIDSLNRTGEYLIESSLQPSNEFDQLNKQLEKINNEYDLLANQFNSILEFKHKLKDSSSTFSKQRQQFYDRLTQIDSRLSELNKSSSTIYNQPTMSLATFKKIINELDTIENEPLNECSRLYEQSRESVYEMVDLTRSSLIENGNQDMDAKLVSDLNSDDELNLKLTQMKSSLNNALNNLQSLKTVFSQSLAREKTYEQLHSGLREFVESKSAQLDKWENLSSSLSKLTADRDSHEKFTRELIARSEEVKKLIEYYNNKIIDSELDEEDPSTHEANAVINEIETSWNNLCSRSDALKEKLFVCFSLAEQFEDVYSNLNSFLGDMNKSVASLDKNDKDSVETKLSVLKANLGELENEKMLNLTKHSKIGNELQQACQLDNDKVQKRVDDMNNKFKNVETELNDKLESTLELQERIQSFFENLENVKSSLVELENEINTNKPIAGNKVDVYERIQENIRTGIKENLDKCVEMSDALKNESKSKQDMANRANAINEVKSIYDKLDSIIEFKINEDKAKFMELSRFQNELSNMDEKLKNIQSLLGSKSVLDQDLVESRLFEPQEVINEDMLEARQNNLNKIKDSLGVLENELQTATSSLNNYLNSSDDDEVNESNEMLKQLQETVRNLTEKCSYLNNLQKKEEETIKEQSQLLQQLQSQIQDCNEEILKCSQDFDTRPINLVSSTKSSSINAIIAEHQKYESDCLSPIKKDLDQINKTSKELFNISSNKLHEASPAASLNPIQMTSLELQLEKLNTNFDKLDAKFKERSEMLDLALFKSSKFEDKIEILNENLALVEAQLEELGKTLFGFDNLELIEEQLKTCNELIKHLLLTSNEIDEFKEICEKIMQNCDNAEDRDIIEKRMDNIIYKWNILTRQLDEKKTNLNFLNEHLNQLNENYINARTFVNELNLKFTSNLTLNCVEPIVIKSQYEKMRDLNDTLTEYFQHINNLKLDANGLISIHYDYQSLNERTGQFNRDEFDDEDSQDGNDNKYLTYLPKTTSSSSVHALSCLFDKADIEAKINEIDSKYNDYKFLLVKNLNLMQRLYPLCEKFSHTIVQLNQSFGKFESELEWLKTSNDNESSIKEKENLFNEIKKGILENENIIANLEGPLSSRIIDELNTTNSLCDEFITDLNNNINQVKFKFNGLNEQLDAYEKLFESRRLKVKELYGEMDDLLEWLDEVDSKFSNLDGISHETDVIQSQLNEQLALNDEIHKQKLKLKQLVENSKRLVRSRVIDDSIELKEKFNGLQVQSNNLFKLGSTRLGELEQALATSKNFTESYRGLVAWFDEVQKELDNIELEHEQASIQIESKELIKKELSLLNKIDRSLQEKKVDFETMNKNGFALAKLCNKNSGLLPSSAYGGSMLISSIGENSSMKDCQSALQLKQSIQFANQRYESFKLGVSKRKEELENLLWKSAEFTDKLDNLTNNLNSNVESCEYAEPISAHPEKLKLQLEESQTMLSELEKRKSALEDLREQLLTSSDIDKQLQQQQAANGNDITLTKENIENKINELDELWHQLKEVSETRAKTLEETLDCSESFWSDFNNLMETIVDLEERLKQIENETVPMDPDSVIEQQQYHEQIVREIDENEANVYDFKDSGNRLIDLCGQSDHPEIQKTVEELDGAWSRIKKLVRDRETELQSTFGKACEFQQELIEILEWISLQQEKFVNLDSSFTSNDPKTIRFQINLLKEFKEQIDPEQIKIHLLNQKFNELKATTKTNQSFDVLESLQEPLNSANKEWKRLQNSIIERKSNLQNALLEMGQFNEALDEMLKWLGRTDQSLDEITLDNDIVTITTSNNGSISSNQLVSSIDIQLAKLKVLRNDIKAQEQTVEKLKETGKNLIRNETTGKQTLQEIKQRVQLLIDNWENLLSKLDEKKNTLNTRLYESQNFQCELQDALLWISEVEAQLVTNKPYGGLPETAKEQLDKFTSVFNQIEANEPAMELLIETGRKLIEKNKKSDDSDQTEPQFQTVEELNQRWTHVKRKAVERKEKLENACKDAADFHNKLQKFISWLTETEKSLNMLKPVSRVLDTLTGQISEHQVLQKNISEHREQMLDLDKLGTHLKYFSQKQDVILIKNLLISVQNRWEKIVSRSAERTRDLERGFKEAKQFYDTWKELSSWLNTSLSSLSQEQSSLVGNNPIKIKQLIVKHKEFHKALSSKQPAYDLAVKSGRKLIEKCEIDHHDKPQLHEMLNDLKNKWQTVCYQSVERQKKLEDALLCSGQFREALQSLLEWLGKVEPTLAESTSLDGDLDSVLALIEDNNQFQQQLQHKADQVALVRKAATELIMNNSNSDDNSSLQEQLDQMNDLWSRVDALAKDRTQRLDAALKQAKEFNAQVRSRLEWLSAAEQQLKYNNVLTYTDNEHEILELIESHQNFVRDLQEQEVLVKQCLALGEKLLGTCIPEAVINLKHWIAVLQSRWDEINQLSEQKCKRLSESLEMCKENENLLGELLAWLQGAEATLTALEQKPIVNNLELVEHLLADHQEFQNEMQSRQAKVERITKSSSVKEQSQEASYHKKSTSMKTLNKIGGASVGWRTPEPKMRNPRVKILFDRWRKVWLLSLDRQRKLKEAIDRLKEMERLKNFSFDEWRRRYMNWHKDNRARITDFFRRQDRDHDGKISREEFIQGILSSSNFKFLFVIITGLD